MVADSKWYAGAGAGKSVPKIKLDEAISGTTLTIPSKYGGGEIALPVLTNSDFPNTGIKAFVGYDIGEKRGWMLEGSLTDFGTYEASAETSIEFSSVTPEGIPFNISGTAEEQIESDLYAATFSVIYSLQLGERISIFPRVGLSYIDGDATGTTSIHASLETPIATRSESLQETKPIKLSGLLAVFGFGVDIQLTEQVFIRSEMERYGNPTDEYVDLYTVSLGYHFK